MSIEWQRTMTPQVVIKVFDARGCIPRSITDPLGGNAYYYFQKARSGKVFLHRNVNSAPPDVGAHAENRLKMKAARAAWRELNSEEKEEWGKSKYARAFNLPGRAAFIGYFMRDLI